MRRPYPYHEDKFLGRWESFDFSGEDGVHGAKCGEDAAGGYGLRGAVLRG